MKMKLLLERPHASLGFLGQPCLVEGAEAVPGCQPCSQLSLIGNLVGGVHWKWGSIQFKHRILNQNPYIAIGHHFVLEPSVIFLLWAPLVVLAPF